MMISKTNYQQIKNLKLIERESNNKIRHVAKKTTKIYQRNVVRVIVERVIARVQGIKRVNAKLPRVLKVF